MKKILVAFLMLIVCGCTMFLTSCTDDGDSTASVQDGRVSDIYKIYVAYEKDNNRTPLSYEEWLASIKGGNGKDGQNGKSAYQIWLDNGHSGSEEDFLNWLKGEDGKQGEKGEQGLPGKDGKGILNIEYKDDVFTITYTDGSKEEVRLQNKNDGTEGLEYYLLPDNTFGVKSGTTIYLDKIVIPGTYKGRSVTQILDYAFDSAKNLKEIQLPNTIEKIQDHAFNNCSALEKIDIPSSVNFIGTYAFYGVKNVVFEDESTWKNIIKPYSKYVFNTYASNSGRPDYTYEYFAVDNFSLAQLLSSKVNVQVSSYSQMLLEGGCKNGYKDLTLYEYNYGK